ALGVRHALVGQAALLVAFVVGVFAVEGSGARETRAGGGAAVGEKLELLPSHAGGLRGLATPWAQGRGAGRDVETTPFAGPVPLAAGKHFVTLTHPDAPNVEREVVIAGGETVMLDVTMNVGAGEDAGAGAEAAPGLGVGAGAGGSPS